MTKRFWRVAMQVAMLFAFACPAMAVTYHIRDDGGTAVQCTGRSNAAYPGTGTGKSCAWSGLLVALPPSGTARIAGGDTLLIHAGTYMVGLDAPGADTCSSDFPWDCFPAALPSGTAAQPTRILGEGYGGACATPPTLWGNERVHRILNLANTNYAEVSCLEITDQSDCVLSHTGTLACQRANYPYGPYADTGIYGYNSSNVKLSKLNIHGLAVNGVHAWHLNNWTVENSRIATSGWVGWNGDADRTFPNFTPSNSGTSKFTNLLVEYNGCGEDHLTGSPIQCWGQSAVGYGDGFSTGQTGGDWVIEDSTFQYNSSDGLDLLYHELGGTITVNRVRTTGNAGNQLKLKGNATVTNAIVHGNCGYFSRTDLTYVYTNPETGISGPSVDDCRSQGDAIVMEASSANGVVSLVNSTVVSEGNTIVSVAGPLGSQFKARNNILVGLTYFLYTPYVSADIYVSVEPGKSDIAVDESYSVKQSLRNVLRCGTANILCPASAGLKTATAIKLDPHLKATSVARGSGLTHAADLLVPTIDYYGNPRGLNGTYDRGAVEVAPAAAKVAAQR